MSCSPQREGGQPHSVLLALRSISAAGWGSPHPNRFPEEGSSSTFICPLPGSEVQTETTQRCEDRISSWVLLEADWPCTKSCFEIKTQEVRVGKPENKTKSRSWGELQIFHFPCLRWRLSPLTERAQVFTFVNMFFF